MSGISQIGRFVFDRPDYTRSVGAKVIAGLGPAGKRVNESRLRANLIKRDKPVKATPEVRKALNDAVTGNPAFVFELKQDALRVMSRSAMYAGKKKAEKELEVLAHRFQDHGSTVVTGFETLKKYALGLVQREETQNETKTSKLANAFLTAVNHLHDKFEAGLHRKGPGSCDYVRLTEAAKKELWSSLTAEQDKCLKALSELKAELSKPPTIPAKFDSAEAAQQRAQIELNLQHVGALQQRWEQVVERMSQTNIDFENLVMMTKSQEILRRAAHITRHPSWSWMPVVMPKKAMNVMNQALQLFGLLTLVASAPLMYVSFKQMFGSEQQEAQQAPPTESPAASYGVPSQAGSQGISA